MNSVIWDALRIRAENRQRHEEANRAQTASLLQAENNYWLKILREQPSRHHEAMDELDRIRVLGRAS